MATSTIVVAGVYKVTHIISSAGTYAKILGAYHKETKQEVAIKVGEDLKGTLKNEIKVYAHLFDKGKDNHGHPRLHLSGKEGKFTYLVMDKMGPSLKDESSNYIKDVPKVILLGIQLLNLVQQLHTVAGVVHGDIKPDNFVFSLDRCDDVEKVFTALKRPLLIDYGLSHIISDPPPYASIVGSPRYASLRILKLYENDLKKDDDKRVILPTIILPTIILPTVWDDLESLGYTLVYLLKGSLPASKETYVYDADLPGEFLLWINYCRQNNVVAKEKPNYAYLKLLLLNLYKMLTSK
jgi:serine/threonine protein kinase